MEYVYVDPVAVTTDLARAAKVDADAAMLSDVAGLPLEPMARLRTLAMEGELSLPFRLSVAVHVDAYDAMETALTAPFARTPHAFARHWPDPGHAAVIVAPTASKVRPVATTVLAPDQAPHQDASITPTVLTPDRVPPSTRKRTPVPVADVPTQF